MQEVIYISTVDGITLHSREDLEYCGFDVSMGLCPVFCIHLTVCLIVPSRNDLFRRAWIASNDVEMLAINNGRSDLHFCGRVTTS